MIDKIIYTNDRGDSVTLCHSAPFFLSNPEGFDGVEADTSTTQSTYQEGVKVHNNKAKERILTLNCHLLVENEEERETYKRQLYRAFNHKEKGTMKIYTEAATKAITNLVVVQTPIFNYDYKTKNELTEFQVQLLAPLPYFEDAHTHKVYLGGEVGNFFFDFEIPDTGRELSYKSDSLLTNVINDGDVDTPLTLVFEARDTVKNPQLLNVYTKKRIKLNITMNKGDRIVITTHVGNKRITLNGEKNIFNKLALRSTFLWLGVGDNILRYSAEEGQEHLSLEIGFTPYYLGV